MKRRQGLRAQMRTWNAMTREMQRAADGDGIPGTYRHGDRTWQTRTFPDADRANAFMEHNPDWGCIHVEGGGRVHVARIGDDGATPR